MGDVVDLPDLLPVVPSHPAHHVAQKEEAVLESRSERNSSSSSSSSIQGFWRLPPEIRNAIYEELLVTDCAFRLGHHGPYSHESRKKIYPAILRTCSQAHHEAVAILYGSNSFFLGPVGFKPTYSASFLTSIGHPNALRIRTIVAHCIHPHLLTRPYLERWFANLGLDTTSLKIIAVSFSKDDEDGKNNRVPSLLPHWTIPTNMNLPVLGSHWPQGTAGSGSGVVVSSPAVPTLMTVTVQTSTPVTSTHAPAHTHHSHGHARVDSVRDDAPETEFEVAAVRNRTWLEKRKRSDVESLVALRNTDLRAAEDWLVYISPAVKKRMGIKLW